MGIWAKLFGKKVEQPGERPHEGAAAGSGQRSEPSDQDILGRMQNELDRAASGAGIEGVILDAYPGHEMSCPEHGAGGVDLFTGQVKHKFRITGDRVVCTACGKTAINPSKGGKPWTGVSNDPNIAIVVAHRRAMLDMMSK